MEGRLVGKEGRGIMTKRYKRYMTSKRNQAPTQKLKRPNGKIPKSIFLLLQARVVAPGWLT